ncbi:M10 family metallopeptidase C-terminal domain-containing protein [Sphingomonas lenta]|uniref:Peptidase metallopeptidase domain-containing protein n=1 Tax=Sphingomonas lenta TaxID=1141887 RepID=A0A2A2SJG9_9SPHN|nr:M10 family metallopeptidase C-terminal domain-containing protein [Sphingomonas lenta]PAX09365.1 hypothetical protein CKY28_01000 [Sphingomonas lenta]
MCGVCEQWARALDAEGQGGATLVPAAAGMMVSDHTALLSGSTVNGAVGRLAYLSFSFPTAVPAHHRTRYDADGLATFAPFDAGQQDMARKALRAFADVSGLSFIEVAPGEGDVLFMRFEMDMLRPGTAGFAFYPSNGWGGEVYSDIFMDHSWAGDLGILLHEIGHAVGLKHPHEGDVTLTPETDHYGSTVMSYKSGGYSRTGLGPFDVSAVKHLYGDPAAKPADAWNAATSTLTQGGTAASDRLGAVGGATNVISGLAGDDLLRGGSGADRLDGGDGADTLRGAGGADQLIGGLGADSIEGGDGADLIDAGGDRDTVWGGAGADVIDGGDGADILNGEDDADVLRGGLGNDTFQGGAGADSLEGGDGDDLFHADGDDVLVGGAGQDTANIAATGSTARRITLSQAAREVETVYVTLGAGDDAVAADGAFGGSIRAGDGADTLSAGTARLDLYGEGGDDTLVAGTGMNLLYGGAGADDFVWTAASQSTTGAVDQVMDFQAGVDVIDLSGFAPTDLKLQPSGGWTWVTASSAGVAFNLWIGSAATLADFVLGSGAIGGTAANDVLRGSAGADTLSGLGGDDVLDGGAGDDLLDGGEGRDTLAGGTGADTLRGGAGDDLYRVSSTATLVVEAAGEGRDALVVEQGSYLLSGGASVELLRAAAGTAAINIGGNEQSQRLEGNDGANILSSGGGGGVDTMAGGLGDDVYRVFATGDVIEDTGGFDTVYASGTSYFLYSTAAVEYLSNSDQAGTEPIYLVGNGASQVIAGNYGNNILNGRGGDGQALPDTLIGLFGNDTYGVFSQGDVVREQAGQGADVVYASASYQLRQGTEVEGLAATDGRAADAGSAYTLRGNEYAQTVVGNAAGNVLDGRGGADTLIGLGGADTFAFTAAPGTSNVDTVQDFASGDLLGLASDVFAGVADGGVQAGEFVLGTAAQDADDRLVYDQATGRLFYDADGSGAGAAVLFAQLAAGTVLTAASFAVVQPVGDIPAA